MSNFIKIRPVRAELFHADGRRERDRQTDGRKNEANSRFRNFAKALKTQVTPFCYCRINVFILFENWFCFTQE